MADKPSQDKTEEPTPRRRQKAKEEGNVPRSTDLNSVAVMLAGVLALQFTSGEILKLITNFMSLTYMDVASISITRESFPTQTAQAMKYAAAGLMPILIIIMLTGIGINYAQVGVVFAKKALVPKFEKISPLKGIKRLFSLRSLVELVKGLFKIGIVGFIGYSVIIKHIPDYWSLAHVGTSQIFVIMGQIIFEMALKIGLTLLVLALLDFAYQRWEFEKNLMMTKEEVREEQKQYEGNPELKARIRSEQRRTARKRMMAAVPDATVVVTNPTTLAVALKYTPLKKDDAPMVVAKGKRKLAEKIKLIAKQNGVPVIEKKLLARGLYETTEPGMEIPIIYYQAMAEILAQVYHLNQKQSSYA